MSSRPDVEAKRRDAFPADHRGLDALEAHADTPQLNRWYFDELAASLRGDVLEVGAGIGNMSALIAEATDSLVVSDMDEAHLESLEERFRDRDDVNTVRYELGGPIPELIEQRTFDAIISLNVIEHVEDDHAAVADLVSRLKSGGHLLTYVPAADWAYGTLDRHLLHYRRYDQHSFRALMEGAGLEVERLRYVNVLGLAGWVVNGRILRRVSLSARQTRVFDFLVPLLRTLEPDEPTFGLGLICHARKR